MDGSAYCRVECILLFEYSIVYYSDGFDGNKDIVACVRVVLAGISHEG